MTRMGFRAKEAVIRCLQAHGGQATSLQIHRWLEIVNPERKSKGADKTLSSVADSIRNPHGSYSLWILKKEYRKASTLRPPGNIKMQSVRSVLRHLHENGPTLRTHLWREALSDNHSDYSNKVLDYMESQHLIVSQTVREGLHPWVTYSITDEGRKEVEASR